MSDINSQEPDFAYETAERLAYAIFNSGWDSLSISEEHILQHDEKLLKFVRTLISMLERQVVIQNAHTQQEKQSLTIFGQGTVGSTLADWRVDDKARKAELFINRRTGKAVLEIKEYLWQDFMSAVYSGVHEVVFQQAIAFDNENELVDKCKTTLHQYGCPEDRVEEAHIRARKHFQKNLY